MTTLVQHKVGETNANQATVPITVVATSAGNLVVVGACNTGTLTVTGVADNAAGGTSLYSQVAGAQFNGTANDLGDVWACLNVKAGVTQITITFSAADTSFKDGWAMEVSGLASPVVDVKNAVSAQTNAGTTDTGASVTTTATDGFVFGIVTTSNGVNANPLGGNEFTAGGDIQATTGNAACSLISTTATAHRPDWGDVGASTYGAATVAFKAGATADIGPATYRQRGGRGPTQGPSMRRMIPQKFPTPSLIDTVTPGPQIQALRSRGPGMGPRLRRMVPQRFQDASTSTTTTLLPTEGAITISGVASSITLTLAAVAGAIIIAGNAPSISTVLQATEGAIVISGSAPSTTTALAATEGTVVIGGAAPSLSSTLVVTDGAVVIGGNAPSIGAATFSPTEGAITIDGNAPSVTLVASSATAERFSGGWEYARRSRKRLEEELRTEREQWGILPKAAQIVAAVAIRQADALGLDAEQRLEELERELELAGVRYQARYLELLNLQRQRLIDAEIRGFFEVEEALNEENKRRLMLLLAFLS